MKHLIPGLLSGNLIGLEDVSSLHSNRKNLKEEVIGKASQNPW
jgi:hypothetical protein